MMRRTPLFLLGAAAGAVLAAVVSQPGFTQFGAFAKSSATTDTYRQLNLFGDVFERVRAGLCRETR